MSRGMIALVLTWSAAALGSAQGQDAPPSQIAGCYTVSIGNWSPALGGDTSLHAVPASVRLDTIPVERGGGWRLSPKLHHLRPATTARTPQWQMAPGGDVRLTWGNGRTLTIAQLILDSGKGLVGEVVALSDGDLEPAPTAQWWNNEPPGSRAPAVLLPRPCGEGAGSADQQTSTDAAERIKPWSVDLALAKRVAGCYELVDGPWRNDLALANIEPVPPGPIRFELTNIPDPDETRLSADEFRTYFETRSSALFASWVRVSGTAPKILVSRPLPMAGFALYVAVRGTELVGTINAFTDAIPPGGKDAAAQPVTARRISCSLLRRTPHDDGASQLPTRSTRLAASTPARRARPVAPGATRLLLPLQGAAARSRGL